MQCPFPAAEVFRCLPARSALVEGVLGADLLVFHSPTYLFHFMKTAKVLLGVKCGRRWIEYNNRLVSTTVRMVGIGTSACAVRAHVMSNRQLVAVLRADCKHFELTPAVTDRMESLRKKFAGLAVVVGLDRLDMCKGIPQKLQAFYTFLEQHEAWRGRVVFVEVVRHKPKLFPYEKPLNREVRVAVGGSPWGAAHRLLGVADQRVGWKGQRHFRFVGCARANQSQVVVLILCERRHGRLHAGVVHSSLHPAQRVGCSPEPSRCGHGQQHSVRRRSVLCGTTKAPHPSPHALVAASP